jgi:hypothetical protein
MEEKATSNEASIIAVEASYRIRLPQPLCKLTGWIAGKQPLRAWLLMASSGRCRLFSDTEVSSDPHLQLVRAAIAEVLEAPGASSIEFQSEVSVALTVRLAEVQLTRHETSGWRLTLPRPIAAIMHLRPAESSLAAFFLQGHIELWTIDVLESFATMPLSEII